MPPVSTPAVLIASAEPATCELLGQLVQQVRASATPLAFRDAQAALDATQLQPFDLAIVDLELDAFDGLELLRQLRQQPTTQRLPCILVSAQVSAMSVRAALPLAPSAYLAKPFNIDDLCQRLQRLLPPEPPPRPPLSFRSVEEYLEARRENNHGGPLLPEVRSAASLCSENAAMDLGELEKQLNRDPQATARLIHIANSAAQHRDSPCQTLGQAIARLGVRRTLNLVLRMAVEGNAHLADQRLIANARQLTDRAVRAAQTGAWLARQLNLDVELCYTAGLLHNLGELALVRCLQDWVDAGGELTDDSIAATLRERGAEFGSALRIQWRVPITLRQLIGGFYAFGAGVFSRETLVMGLTRHLLNLDREQNPASLLNTREARMLDLDARMLERIPLASLLQNA